MAKFQLAQVNIAFGKSTLDDPIMAGFASQLDRINALAEESKGFVWRLRTESGDATSMQAFDDERIIVNLSVWQSIENLKNYVYSGEHLELLKNKKEWFDKAKIPHLAMWWIPCGSIPTISDAKDRLNLINELGSTQKAFNFTKSFSEPKAGAAEHEKA